MPKLLSKIVMTAMLVSLTTTAQAQIPSAAPSIPPAQPTPANGVPSPTASPSPTPSTTPAASTTDIKLLGKALGVFWQGNRAQTNSQIVMTVQEKNTNKTLVQINATVKTIAQTGDKFRSELIVSKAGSPTKLNYTIVCDGQNVWVYRPDKRQYAQTTFPAFKGEYYSLLIGLSSVFFVSMSETGRKEIIADISANRSPLQSIPQNEIKNLQGSNRQVDGQNLYAYSYDNSADKSNFTGLVQPDTGVLKQIEFTSNDARGDLKIVEKILTHATTNNNANDRLFKFAPPRGVRKVKSLSGDLNKLLQ